MKIFDTSYDLNQSFVGYGKVVRSLVTKIRSYLAPPRALPVLI